MRVVERERDRAACATRGSSTFPTLTRRPAGTRSACPGELDFGGRASRARAPPPSLESDRRRAPAPRRRRGTGPSPALTFAPVAASRWAITPLTGARIDEQPFGVGRRRRRAPRCTARDWPRPRRGGSWPAPRRIAPRPAACRARRPRSSAARHVRDRASPAQAPSALPRAPAAAAADRPAPRAAAAAGRAPGRARRWRPSGTSTTRVRRPSIGATTSAAPPGLASSRAGTRMDSRTACSFTMAVPKSRLHCCSFRKLMPGRLVCRRRRGGARRFRVGVHLDLADAVFIVRVRSRCSTIDELALARRAPASRRRRRCRAATGASTRKTSGWPRRLAGGPPRSLRSAP